MTTETETREEFIAKLMKLVMMHVSYGGVSRSRGNVGMRLLGWPTLPNARDFTVTFNGPATTEVSAYSADEAVQRAKEISDWDWVVSDDAAFTAETDVEVEEPTIPDTPSLEELKQRVPQIVMDWIEEGHICRHGGHEFIQQLGLEVPVEKTYEVIVPIIARFSAHSPDQALQKARDYYTMEGEPRIKSAD